MLYVLINNQATWLSKILIVLSVHDIDYDYFSVMVWQGKGNKNRRTTLAPELVVSLKQQSQYVLQYFQADTANPGYAGVWLPYALARKYPSASKELGWQYLFPSLQLSVDPDSKLLRRHHLDESCVRREIKIAARKAGIRKNVTCHTLRHSFIKCVHAFYPSGHPADVQIHSR